ncbi:MAG TPA: CCA tRNA nucleotidyltransferase [Alphaproteobacteria bacterium]|nr:CCA tRNA nucleotidyltransferase [Alphaproteobacteria bacterium]
MIRDSRLDPTRQEWLQAGGLRRIFAVIEAGGGRLRIVGGAVRDALLEKEIGEVDLACDLPPEKTAEILAKAGIKVAPTGIEHGTITAVVDHQGYEITALRRDIETDGRRAKVEFTDDWQADAARRDFTINAIYADADGTLYDYFGGRGDLAEGRVRFIGQAEARIREDVLRILRFFRFYAFFGRGDADAEGLRASAALAHLLPQLSAERVWREIGKLLAAENPAPSWRLMGANGVLAQVLPDAADVARLEGLLAAEKKYEVAGAAQAGAALTRLAALLPQDEAVAAQVAAKLKMARREAERVRLLAVLPARLRGRCDPLPLRCALYDYGADACRAAALLLAASDRGIDLDPVLAAAAAWDNPVFPLQGADILQLGVAPGPRVGEILRAVEEWWMARDFRPGKKECLDEAKRLAAA